MGGRGARSSGGGSGSVPTAAQSAGAPESQTTLKTEKVKSKPQITEKGTAQLTDKQAAKVIEKGKLWEKGEHKRSYVEAEGVTELANVEVNFYGTGNISSAYVDGKKISNSEARRMGLGNPKIYYDHNTKTLHMENIPPKLRERIVDQL